MIALQGQWADSLLSVERLQAARLLAWSLLSVAAGTGVMAWAHRRGDRSPLLLHFGVQLMAWGVLQAGIALYWRMTAGLRDLPAAIGLERMAWFGTGLDSGFVIAGAALAIIGRSIGRPALIGAGVGVAVQGAARLLLDLQLASIVTR